MLPTPNTQNLLLSQASLQDFVDCRRRYQLRHLLRLAWPAIESEPVLANERMMQQGAHFHRMIQQYLAGVDPVRLAAFIHDPDLQRWSEHFEQAVESGQISGLKDALYRCYPEVSLSAPLASARLIAKCDLILVSPEGRAVIYDWKTARKRPGRAGLAARLQSRVYPYLLACAGAHLNQGKPFDPAQIEMVYWYAEFPDQPEVYAYSLEQYQADDRYLNGLVAEILSLPATEFPLTSQIERCRFCVYRSLCERGAEAGSPDVLEPELDFDATGDLMLDFDQIGEIAF
jgi:hypothetical protein